MAILAAAMQPSTAAANGAPVRIGPGPGVAGTAAPVESDRIRLVEEQVDLEVFPLYTVGRVRYVLRNEGPDTSIDFGFPTLVLESRANPEELGFVDYRIAVDDELRESSAAPGEAVTVAQALGEVYRFDRLRGKLAPIRRQTPGKIEYSPFTIPADRLFRQVRAARREYRITPLAFSAGERKTVEIEFTAYNLVVSAPFNIWRPHGTLEEGFYYFGYLATPAAAWKGAIGRADFRVRFYGTPPWTERWSAPLGPVAEPEPHARANHLLEWHFEQWEPAEDIGVLVPFAIEDYRLSRGVLERYGDSVVHPSAIAGADASSAINRRQRSALSAFDGDLDGTAWVSEPNETGGVGETISVKLAAPRELSGVGIVPGVMATSDKFHKIGRPKTIRVTTSGGFSEALEIEDRALFPFVTHLNMQAFDFGAPVTAAELTFEIVETHPGRLARPATSVAVSEIVLLEATAPTSSSAPAGSADAGPADAGTGGDQLPAVSGPAAEAGPAAPPSAERGPRGCSCAVVSASDDGVAALLLLTMLLCWCVRSTRARQAILLVALCNLAVFGACGDNREGESADQEQGTSPPVRVNDSTTEQKIEGIRGPRDHADPSGGRPRPPSEPGQAVERGPLDCPNPSMARTLEEERERRQEQGAAGVELTDVLVKGPLSTNLVKRIVRQHLAEVWACCEREMVAHPDLAGRFAIKFIISGDGKVRSAGLVDSDLGNPKVEDCAVEAVKRWMFPETQGGVEVFVTAAFEIATQGLQK